MDSFRIMSSKYAINHHMVHVACASHRSTRGHHGHFCPSRVWPVRQSLWSPWPTAWPPWLLGNAVRAHFATCATGGGAGVGGHPDPSSCASSGQRGQREPGHPPAEPGGSRTWPPWPAAAGRCSGGCAERQRWLCGHRGAAAGPVSQCVFAPQNVIQNVIHIGMTFCMTFWGGKMSYKMSYRYV